MKSKSKMSYNLSVILLIPLGIAINFVGANLTAALKLPVYLDVIGTVFTGVLCTLDWFSYRCCHKHRDICY